ncbi:hypothetical protein DFH07DRAFT_970604 [Mycena maculata]|uniref:F-box domain-containing protein n=1 Tax=Mycena maculata TaxID=230809 RepID=A0AAD7HQR4_9AGAR|nr:hypothetical protein DFH07DRAFT_970604 [Mycena maculata]
MNTFPTELIEQVIDNLSDDAFSIASCGLVCRQWTPRSRYHLFATPLDLQFSPLPGFSKGRTEPDIKALKALARSPVQTFAPFVRALNVMGPIGDIYPTLMDLAPLANIATLTVVCNGNGRSIAIPPELEHLLRAVPLAFPRVRALHLIGGEFTLAQLTALACGFPALDALYLDPVRWAFEDSTHRAAPRARPLPASVRTLDMGAGTGFYAVLPWIIAHGAPPALDTLCIETTSISIKDFAGLRDVLRVLGPTLRHLELFFITRDVDAWWSKRKAVYITQYLTLAHNPALRSVRCGVVPRYGAEICSALIASVLPTLCAPALHCIALLLDRAGRAVYAPHGDALLLVPWGDLDRLVAARPSVARLEVLHDLYPADEVLVTGALPRCEARGIVFFRPE